MARKYLGLSPETPDSENTWLAARTVVDRRCDNSVEEGSCISGKAAMEMLAMIRAPGVLLQE